MTGPSGRRPARTAGMSAKEEILARLRTALEVPRRDEPTTAEDVPRDYQRADHKQETSTDPAKIRDLLVKRLEDYTAVVHRTTAAGTAAAIAGALEEAASVVVPTGLPEEWSGQLRGTVVPDTGVLSPHQLDGIDAVLTGCHTAIAQTGTLVLRGDGIGGRRAISLVPDHHVVVVDATADQQVVLGVPKGIEQMGTDPTAAWTMISGPSATSDIELDRVEGVHGPRRLDVVLIEPDPDPEEPAPQAEGSPPAHRTDDPQETRTA